MRKLAERINLSSASRMIGLKDVLRRENAFKKKHIEFWDDYFNEISNMWKEERKRLVKSKKNKVCDNCGTKTKHLKNRLCYGCDALKL